MGSARAHAALRSSAPCSRIISCSRVQKALQGRSPLRGAARAPRRSAAPAARSRSARPRGPRAQGAQRLLLLQQQLLLPLTPGRLVRAGWREAATGGGWRQGPRRRTLERRSAAPAWRGPQRLAEPEALPCWRFPLAVCRRRWVGRAAALAYSSFLDVSSLRRSAAGGRSGLSRVRLALRLSSLSGHRCGERVGRLLRQRRRAAACPCLLVLDEPAFTSPANVSRPSPTRSRSLLRRFLQRDHGIGGRARRRPSRCWRWRRSGGRARRLGEAAGETAVRRATGGWRRGRAWGGVGMSGWGAGGRRSGSGGVTAPVVRATASEEAVARASPVA